MALFDRKSKKVVEFVKTAGPAGLMDKMNPDKREQVESFVRDYLASTAPVDALREYRLKVEVYEAVFDRTHTLVKSVIAGLEFWSLPAGNAAAIQAETGPWLVGEDEADDLAQLEKLHAAFVKHFGAAALPPALKAEELRKQLAAHRKAAAEMPKTPPAQLLSTLRASHRELSAACDEAFESFHDFLDGYYGKNGNAAFEQKANYGYDRRAGRYRSSGPSGGDGEGTGGDEGSGTGGDGGTGAAQSATKPKGPGKS